MVVLFPTPSTTKGVQFTNEVGRVSINDLDLNHDDNNDNNSNVFDESFDHDKDYQDEFDKEEKTRFDDLATDKVQEEHFQLPFQ